MRCCFWPATPATAVIRIEDGLLKVTMVSRSGSERILAFLDPGGGGARSYVEFSQPRRIRRVRAKPSRGLQNAGRASRPRLRETDIVIAAGSFLPLKGRVASTLLELAENFGQDVGSGRIVIQQKIAQSDIAAMAGIARENVSRILNDWKRRKLVSRLSGYYCLENKAQLEHEAEL